MILNLQNKRLNKITTDDFGLPSKADVMIMDPLTRIARALRMEQNKDSVKHLQLSEAKHLEYVAASAAVTDAISELAEHRNIDTDDLNAGGRVQHASTLRELQTNLTSTHLHKRQLDTAPDALFASLRVCCSVINTEPMRAAISKKSISCTPFCSSMHRCQRSTWKRTITASRK